MRNADERRGVKGRCVDECDPLIRLLLGGKPEEPASPALAAVRAPLEERIGAIERELHKREQEIEQIQQFQ